MDSIRDVLELPPCCQVGFVYPNLEEAIALYEPLFGEFKIVDYGEMEGASFRGKPSPYRLRMGIGYSGDLELELIEWVSGETPHKEFVQSGRTGMHHLSFTVPELDAVVELAVDPGPYEPILDLGSAQVFDRGLGISVGVYFDANSGADSVTIHGVGANFEASAQAGGQADFFVIPVKRNP